jgi:hypothetical protein
MGPFSKRLCFSFLKSLRGRHYSLIQPTQFTRLSKLLDTLPSSMKDFIRTRVFLYSLKRGYLAERWCSSLMKKLRLRQCSFREPTQFTMLNKVVDLIASNFNVSLWRATVLFPFTIEGSFCKKFMIQNCDNTNGYAEAFENVNWIHNTKQVARPSCF